MVTSLISQQAFGTVSSLAGTWPWDTKWFYYFLKEVEYSQENALCMGGYNLKEAKYRRVLASSSLGV